MGEVVRFRRPKASEKHKGKTLCRSGFHKWETDNSKPFEVREGRLMTVLRCRRCGATKVEPK